MNHYLFFLRVFVLTLFLHSKSHLLLLLKYTPFEQSRFLLTLIFLSRPISYLFGFTRTSALLRQVLLARSVSSFSSYLNSLNRYESYISQCFLAKSLISIYPQFRSFSSSVSHSEPSMDFSNFFGLPTVILGPQLDLANFDLKSYTNSDSNLILLSNLNRRRDLGSLNSTNYIFSFYNNAVAKRNASDIQYLLTNKFISGAIFRNNIFSRFPLSLSTKLFSLSHQCLSGPLFSPMGLPIILAELYYNNSFSLSSKIYAFGFSMMTGHNRYNSNYGNINNYDYDLDSLRTHDSVAQYILASNISSKFTNFHCDTCLSSILNSSLDSYISILDATFDLHSN